MGELEGSDRMAGSALFVFSATRTAVALVNEGFFAFASSIIAERRDQPSLPDVDAIAMIGVLFNRQSYDCQNGTGEPCGAPFVNYICIA